MDRWTGWSDSLRGVAVGAARTRCVRELDVPLRPRPALVTDPHLGHRTGVAEPVQLGDHPLTQRRGVEGVHVDLRPALEAGQGGHPPLEHDLPRHRFGDTGRAVVPLLVGRHRRAGGGVQRVQQVRDTADLVVVVLPGQAGRAGRPDLQRGVAIAAAGHRYPSLEIWSASPSRLPWEHDDDEVGGVSDLLHALHAASGTAVPTNEEWHHRPPGIAEPMPWQIVLKWRVSTLAGFEGGTKINVNTLDPATLRARVVAELHRLRDAGAVASMRIGDECRPGAQQGV